MSANVSTIVNFMNAGQGSDFRVSNPADILPYLRATEQHWKSKGDSRYQWRTCVFKAKTLDETRFLPTVGLVSSCFIVEEMSGPREEVYQLLNKLIAAAERANAALIFVPIRRSSSDPAKSKKDPDLVEIASELFSERLKRTAVETQFNRSIPLFLHRSEGLPLYSHFDDVTEACDEAK